MRQSGHPAIQWGLIFGIVLSVLTILANSQQLFDGRTYDLSSTTSQATPTTSLALAGGALLLEVVSYLLAGLLTARQTGTVGSGAFAGALAGMVSGFMSALIIVLFASKINIPALNDSGLNGGQSRGLFGGLVLGYAACGFAAAALVGAGIAAIGALFGRLFYRPEDDYDDEYDESYGGLPMTDPWGAPPPQRPPLTVPTAQPYNTSLPPRHPPQYP